MKCYSSSGTGLLNSSLNRLPLPEMHLPGYNFCGPFTKLEKRLARGDKGINDLDEACKEHDIAYSTNKDLENRHEADKILGDKAMARFLSKNASRSEKLAALGVTSAMRAKVKLGMGYNSSDKSICMKVIRKCSKTMDKLKKTANNSLKNINDCLNELETYKINNRGKPPRVQTTRTITRMKNKNTAKAINENDLTIRLLPPPPLKKTRDFIKRKLKFDVEGEEKEALPLKNKKSLKRKLETADIKTPIKTAAVSRRRRKRSSNRRKKTQQQRKDNVVTSTDPSKAIKRKLNFGEEEEDTEKNNVNLPSKRQKLISRKRKLNHDSDDDDDGSLFDLKKSKLTYETTPKRKLNDFLDEDEDLQSSKSSTPVLKRIKI